MIGKRVVVQLGRPGRKFGKVTGETRDGLSWYVLLDGNACTRTVPKEQVTLLKPTQLAFHFGDQGKRA